MKPSYDEFSIYNHKIITMKTNIKFIAAIFIAAFFAFSCEKDLTTTSTEFEKDKLIHPETVAKGVLALMQDADGQSLILDYLVQNKFGGSLSNIHQKLCRTTVNESAMNDLKEIIEQSETINELAEETGVIQIPELWLYSPSTEFKSSEVLISFAPEGDEETWKSIKAYTLSGEIVYLDPDAEPNVPVIVVELNGMESLKFRVELMNKELQALGLQKRESLKMINLKSTQDLETTKIDKIRLEDDKETWIKGAAEIYAITSGIRGSADNKEAEIQIVAMPYLDDDSKDYYPNQIIFFWDDYAYQAANFQLYEQDSNYNYKDLVKIITEGVFEITGILTAEPWISALGKVAAAIIEAMPDEWYTDDDDYVDSFYTIEKNKTYTNYNGAAGNAKVSMTPFIVQDN